MTIRQVKLLAAALALAVLTAAGLYAASLPTSSPTHRGLSQNEILGYIADNTQMQATGAGVATLPASAPTHKGLSQGELLGYIADNTQDMAAARLPVFRPETYGANATSGNTTDDKAAIQAAIDAAISAGGGIVQLSAGRYVVDPAATGIGLLTDGEYVILRGAGEGTEIQFKGSTASIKAWCGIAPKRYDTCTAPYTAAPLLIEDMRLTSDEYASTLGHDLIGIAHCPWAIIRRVGFQQIKYHAWEVNCSKNVLVEDCYTYGTGNIAACIWEIDGLGNCGQIATGGTHSSSTPLENITVRRFIQRVPRTDLTIDTAGYSHALLSHTNSNNVLRNVTIEGCSIIPHNDHDIASGTTLSEISFDSAALPLTVDGLYIRNNTFAATGGLTGSTQLINLGCASSSTRNIRNVVVERNTIYSPHFLAITAGAVNSTTNPRTSITDAILRSHDGIVIRDNTIAVNLNGNTGTGTRATRSIWLGACRSASVTGNTVAWPDNALGSGWGTSSAATFNWAFWLDHPQSLVMENNTVEITRPQTGGTGGTWCQVYAFCMGVGAYEIQTSLAGHWRCTGNRAVGNGNIGVNLAAGFLMTYGTGTDLPSWTTANKSNPRMTGYWAGNWSMQTGTGTWTHTLQATYPDYWITAASITNTAQTEAQLASMGTHDWYPSAGTIGTVCTVPAGTTMAPGWKLYDGSAVTGLDWIKESAWNQKLGLSATTTLPTTSNTYIRLGGN